MSRALPNPADSTFHDRLCGRWRLALLAIFAISFVVALALFAPYSGPWRLAWDFLNHGELALRISRGEAIRSPHFLTQWLALGVSEMFRVGMGSALWLLMGLSYATIGVAIGLRVAFLDGARVTAATLLFVLCATFVAHIFVMFVPFRNIYSGFLVPLSLHNPSQQVMKAMAVCQISLLWAAYAVRRRLTTACCLALLSSFFLLASLLAKPSYGVIALPAFGLFFLFCVPPADRLSNLLIGAIIAVPAVVTLWFQYGVYFENPDIGPLKSTVAFGAFEVFSNPAVTLPKVLLTIALPIWLTRAVWYNEQWRERLLLGWFMFGLGAFLSFFFYETGPRKLEGNFAWSGQIGVYVLLMETLLVSRCLWERLQQQGDRRAKWLLIVACIYAAHAFLFASLRIMEVYYLGITFT